MNTPPILSPVMAPRPALDLRIYAHWQTHGEFDVVLTWYITTGEPCIVLLPSGRRPDDMDMIPCVVTLNNAFRWDESLGDPVFIKDTLEDWAPALGFGTHDNRRKNRVLSLIRDYLGEMIAMPPAGHQAHEVVADVFHRDLETGKVKHIEVKDHV